MYMSGSSKRTEQLWPQASKKAAVRLQFPQGNQLGMSWLLTLEVFLFDFQHHNLIGLYVVRQCV